MYKQVEKPKEHIGRSVANSVAQKDSAGKQVLGVVDNRSAIAIQRKLKLKGTDKNLKVKDAAKPFSDLLIKRGLNKIQPEARERLLTMIRDDVSREMSIEELFNKLPIKHAKAGKTGRPSFSNGVRESVPVSEGEDRRHVVAYYEMHKAAERLDGKKEEARKLIIEMNNQVGNLYAGSAIENQTLGTLMVQINALTQRLDKDESAVAHMNSFFQFASAARGSAIHSNFRTVFRELWDEVQESSIDLLGDAKEIAEMMRDNASFDVLHDGIDLETRKSHFKKWESAYELLRLAQEVTDWTEDEIFQLIQHANNELTDV